MPCTPKRGRNDLKPGRTSSTQGDPLGEALVRIPETVPMSDNFENFLKANSFIHSIIIRLFPLGDARDLVVVVQKAFFRCERDPTVAPTFHFALVLLARIIPFAVLFLP